MFLVGSWQFVRTRLIWLDAKTRQCSAVIHLRRCISASWERCGLQFLQHGCHQNLKIVIKIHWSSRWWQYDDNMTVWYRNILDDSTTASHFTWFGVSWSGIRIIIKFYKFHFVLWFEKTHADLSEKPGLGLGRTAHCPCFLIVDS